LATPDEKLKLETVGQKVLTNELNLNKTNLRRFATGPTENR